MKNDVCVITDSLLDDTCPLGNEHNRERTMELIKAGAIHKDSIECIKLSSRIECLIDIIVFKFHVTPSMKSEVINVAGEDCRRMNEHHTTYLAFDGKTKKMLPHPYCVCMLQW